MQHWDSDAPWYDDDRGRAGGDETRVPIIGRVWIPVVISFLVQVPTVAILALRGSASEPGHPGRRFPGAEPHLPDDWFLAVGLALIGPLALIGARRFPGPVAAVAAAAGGALVLVRPDIGLPYVALAFAVVLGILRGARVWVYSSVAAVWVATIGLAGILDFPLQPARIAFTTLVLAALMGLGEWLRSRRDRISTLRRTAVARRQTAEQRERVRIARELHDVLAHSLSQINVQAGVALHLLDSQPDRAAESLASIKATSKNALDEVRTVLGILRSDVSEENSAPLAPEPDLDRLPALIESFRNQGMRVELAGELGPVAEAAGAATQLALYRICQEALTNVLRHAPTRSAAVRLAVDGGDAVLTVTDGDGLGQADAPITPGGGLLGMRERAELLGGTLRVSPSGDGFEVEARLPLGRTR
ncbi:sensor histidine kinase [Cryobacterium sp. TMT2-10]|uniref:histidine kinase n=1 Tax=Cryobacterium shii TaxID=1259235 RepID=A0AAQ2C7D5_9MICO|nr:MULTISPECIES: sensor histidine kinase [Cryobacterium]TFC50147.1 sensor histidine kinase [Cryobacterium shii]TFD41945.1 sensor histidine kinase [Cryobacterium sp. TMT2-10]